MRATRRGAAAFLAVALAAGVTGTVPPAAATPDDDFTIVVFPQPHPETHFSSTFGARRPGGRRHQGNDLMGEKMMPVVAVADGVVDHVAESRTAGFYVIVDHGDGWASWYLHLNNDTPGTDDGAGDPDHAFAVAEGDEVAAGDLIGWVGDSGNAEGTSPHTHFELRRRGRAINPYPYLDAAWEMLVRRWDRADEVA